jgi:hypothetical protein
MVFILFLAFGGSFEATLVSEFLAVSAFLKPSQMPKLLEGQADDCGLGLRDDQINSLPDIRRQGVGETGSSRTILSRFSFHDHALTFQAGQVQPQGVVRKPHFLQDLVKIHRSAILQHGQDLPIKRVHIKPEKAKGE